jgi:predicted double-glycine peptidase
MNHIQDDWRNDPSLQCQTVYRRKFAFWKKEMFDGTTVWLKYYYTKYKIYGHMAHPSMTFSDDDYYLHTDVIEHIDEKEYIVRKLIESL